VELVIQEDKPGAKNTAGNNIFLIAGLQVVADILAD
jgi:hypothetical protein